MTGHSARGAKALRNSGVVAGEPLQEVELFLTNCLLAPHLVHASCDPLHMRDVGRQVGVVLEARLDDLVAQVVKGYLRPVVVGSPEEVKQCLHVACARLFDFLALIDCHVTFQQAPRDSPIRRRLVLLACGQGWQGCCSCCLVPHLHPVRRVKNVLQQVPPGFEVVVAEKFQTEHLGDVSARRGAIFARHAS